MEFIMQKYLFTLIALISLLPTFSQAMRRTSRSFGSLGRNISMAHTSMPSTVSQRLNVGTEIVATRHVNSPHQSVHFANFRAKFYNSQQAHTTLRAAQKYNVSLEKYAALQKTKRSNIVTTAFFELDQSVRHNKQVAKEVARLYCLAQGVLLGIIAPATVASIVDALV
jgi:hypothetical protein